MRKIIILLSTLLIIIGCKIQKRDNHQSENNMEYLDLNKYKNWEKDPKYNSTNEMKFYKKEDKRVKILFLKNLIQKDWIQIEESSIITPYTYISIYDSKTGLMLSFTKQFYMMKVGIGKQYNNIGKLIKEEDYDRGYTFTIKDLVQKILKEYKIDLEDRREENSVRRREYKGNLFYEVDMKIKDISIDKYKYLLIDGKTGVLLFETFFYPKGYNQVFPFDKYLNYLKEKDNKRAKIIIDKDIRRIRISSINDPYTYVYQYYIKTDVLKEEIVLFYDMIIGKIYTYNEIGKIIKEENWDTPYKISIKELIIICKKKLGLDLMDMSLGLRVERYSHLTPIYVITIPGINMIAGEANYITISADNGEILFEKEIHSKEEFKKFIEEIYNPSPSKSKDNKAIKTTTFNGKTYTEEEWKAFEQEQWEKYQAKRNKKGFWDKLFG